MTKFIVLIVVIGLMIIRMDDRFIMAIRYEKSAKPNIIIIVSDDMGFNDVGSHGAQHIPTPNIDALGVFGVQLNRYYTAPMCTPCRSSLMTGKYASNLGMQHSVILSEQPFGLDLSEKLLPEYMRDAGYSTHMIGKWHLGFYKKVYTPTYRGFDSHFGYLGPHIDYWHHNLYRIGLPWTFGDGYDMRKNLSIHYGTNRTYATDLFTRVAVDTIYNHNQEKPLFLYLAHLAPHTGNEYDPLQAPDDELEEFDFIKDENRRKYAAMVSRLDKGVGRVMTALKESRMLDNSIVLFFSDNGAATHGVHGNFGSNKPFRGQKGSLWDGSSRSSGFIWSPLIKSPQRVSTQLFHITDWLPTFAHIAGIQLEQSANLDGFDIWEAISTGSLSPRNEVLINLDNDISASSYIRGNYKWMNGTTSPAEYDGWLGDINESEIHPEFNNYPHNILLSDTGIALSSYNLNNLLTTEKISNHLIHAKITCNNYTTTNIDPKYQCHPLISPCLFNIMDDPCETTNLYSVQSDVLDQLLPRIRELQKIALPPRNKPSDHRADPTNFNNTWTWWFDELNISENVEIKGSGIIFFIIVVSCMFVPLIGLVFYLIYIRR